MNPNTRQLHERGQRLWLDELSRPMLRSGVLAQYIAQFSITGLMSQPQRLLHALRSSNDYDASIHVLARAGMAGEDLLFELLMEDLSEAADLLRPLFDASAGRDGWVCLDVSPLLAENTAHTIRAAARIRARAERANLLVKIPGNPAGLAAIEEALFDGVPVDMSVLFSPQHYLGAADAFMRAIERRIEARLDPAIDAVASVFVNGWDEAVQRQMASPFHNRLGLAMAQRCWHAHRGMLGSARWLALAAAGARPPRLLWAGTACHDPLATDTLYVEGLRASDTITTLSESTLQAFAEHGRIGYPMDADQGYAEAVVDEFRREGLDEPLLAAQLQHEAIEQSAQAWHALLALIASRSVIGETVAS